MAMRPPSPPQEQLLLGKYRVEKVLGEGGMGRVVLATHVHLKQRVAIKFLLSTSRKKKEYEEVRARFLREAQTACKLQSEHAAKVSDVGEMEDGSPYMVMEYLEGQDLKQVLEERGALSIEEACRYMMQACEALAEAHFHGVVHRDIKPDNIFLSRRVNGDQIAKLLDFGIAKADDGSQLKTAYGMGTIEYMPPEQLSNAGEVTVQSDIWALGVTLFELLTKRTPFNDGNDDLRDLVNRIEHASPAWTLRMLRPDAPLVLEQTLSDCLQKNPKNRPSSVSDFVSRLASFSPRQGFTSTEQVKKLLDRSTSSLQVIAHTGEEDKTRLWQEKYHVNPPSVAQLEDEGKQTEIWTGEHEKYHLSGQGTIPASPSWNSPVPQPRINTQPSFPEIAPGGTQPAFSKTTPRPSSSPRKGLLVGIAGVTVLLGGLGFVAYSSLNQQERASRPLFPSSSVVPPPVLMHSVAASPASASPAVSASGLPVVSFSNLPRVTVPPKINVPATTNTPKPSPSKPNCNPNYTILPDGTKKYKQECL